MTELFVLLHTAVLGRAIHCQLTHVALSLQGDLLSVSRPQVTQTVQDLLCVDVMLTACSDAFLHLLMGRFCRLQLALH